MSAEDSGIIDYDHIAPYNREIKIKDIPKFVLKHWEEWKDGTMDELGKRTWKYKLMKYGLIARDPNRIFKDMAPEEKEKLKKESKKRRMKIYMEKQKIMRKYYKENALCTRNKIENVSIDT
jgi:hypothetical protein